MRTPFGKALVNVALARSTIDRSRRSIQQCRGRCIGPADRVAWLGDRGRLRCGPARIVLMRARASLGLLPPAGEDRCEAAPTREGDVGAGPATGFTRTRG